MKEARIKTTYCMILFTHFSLFKKYLFILRERERERMLISGEGAKKEGERESQAVFALTECMQLRTYSHNHEI